MHAVIEPALHLHQRFDDTLLGVLRDDACAHVVLNGDAVGFAEPLLERLRESSLFDETAVGRLHFRAASSLDAARLAARADVVIDPVPFGGRATAALALSSGTPVVAARGRHQRGRYAAALLDAYGFGDELVAASDSDLAALAVRTGQRMAAERAAGDASTSTLRDALQKASAAAQQQAGADGGSPFAEELAAWLRRATAALRPHAGAL